MSKFINFTNHISERWNEKQLSEAKKYGDIIDIPFPSISPTSTEEELLSLAESYTEQILSHEPSCVLCQAKEMLPKLSAKTAKTSKTWYLNLNASENI